MRLGRLLVIFIILVAATGIIFFACSETKDSGDDETGGDDTGPQTEQTKPVELHYGWAIRSSSDVKQTGDVISAGAFSPDSWYGATVPSTVLAALVDDGVYPDPSYGLNLYDIPGNWPMGLDVSLSPRPPNSPFSLSWWYRTSFTLPQYFTDKTVWLRFAGINFRADIWLNGRLIADRYEVAGSFRAYEFNVTDVIRIGGPNVLAVEIFPPGLLDLAYNWVDWGPAPQDRNMGIIGPVTLSAGGIVALRNPQVVSQLDLPSMQEAHLTVAAELINATGQSVTGTLRGSIDEISFEKNVTLAPSEKRLIEFAPEEYPALNIKNPQVWWPTHLGSQPLYVCNMSFDIQGEISDAQSVRFGIRSVTSRLTQEGYRIFQINGKDILIRGGAWSPDILLRSSAERDEADVRYALDMNLNAIRLEGKPVTERFMSLCDEVGIFIISGWCCCDHWENWWAWNNEDRQVAAESLKNQALTLRNHPSVLAWLNGSDGIPPPDIEQMYNDILAEYRWPDVILSSAKQHISPLTGPSGVKMTGPYEYVPPEYWLADTTRGGAFGFNMETGPGPAVPPIESLKRFLPRDHYWPIDRFWIYHAGRGFYMTLRVFTHGIEARYGAANGIEDYAKKSQIIAYDNHRAMFEAYGRNKYHSTGVIQWMMNNQWPSMIWHLYDYFLRPGGAYFGAKKGCEPLHVQYSYDDRSIVVVNSYFQSFSGMTVTAHVYNFDLTEKYRQEAKLDVAPDASIRVFTIPEIPDLSLTYFIKLYLEDNTGKVVSNNFYWLSTKPTEMAWNLANQSYTPTKSEADLTMLASLPPTKLEVSQTIVPSTVDDQIMHVRLRNPSSTLAFAIQLRLTRGPGGSDITPVFWEDNYFSLMPGEEREVIVRFKTASLQGLNPTLEVGGWNAERL